MSLKYELSVKNFTCDECGEFSDEISIISSDIMNESITAMCCDTEYYQYDLTQLGYDVIEEVHVV